jgi:hypothetical protein
MITDIKFKNKITWAGGRNGGARCIGITVIGYKMSSACHPENPYSAIALRPINSKGRLLSGARIGIPVESIPDLIEAMLLAAGEKFDFSCIAALAARAGRNGAAR